MGRGIIKKMTQKTEEAIKIAEQIQEDITDGKVTTLNILRKYLKLVTLIEKKDEVEWALNELIGYSNDKTVPFYRIMVSKVDENIQAFIRESCGIINGRWSSGKDYEYEWNIQPNKTFPNYCLVNSETFYNVLNHITNIVYTKTSRILLKIKFGKFEFDIF